MNNKKNLFLFNWVLINELAIGTGPRTKFDLAKLESEGIKSILSLCKEVESTPPKEICKLFNHERIVLPDHTFNKKITFKEINFTLDRLKKLKSIGPVFIHCKAAVERSPLICIAWLVRDKKLTIQQALNYLMRVNSGTCPSMEDLNLLKKLNND